MRNRNKKHEKVSYEEQKTMIVAAIVLFIVAVSAITAYILIKTDNNPFGETPDEGYPVSLAAYGEDEEDLYEADSEYDDEQNTDFNEDEPDEMYEEDEEDEDEEEYYQESDASSFDEACRISLERELKSEDIDTIYRLDPGNLPETPLQMAINYMYAWHGYHFKTEKIAEYFKSMYWYEDEGKTIEQCEADMNGTEKKNLDKLIAIRGN